MKILLLIEQSAPNKCLLLTVIIAHHFIVLLQCDVVEGKTVPKAFHRFHNIGEGGESSWLGSDLYQTAQVLKGSPHEVMTSLPMLVCLILISNHGICAIKTPLQLQTYILP